MCIALFHVCKHTCHEGMDCFANQFFSVIEFYTSVLLLNTNQIWEQWQQFGSCWHNRNYALVDLLDKEALRGARKPLWNKSGTYDDLLTPLPQSFC